MVEQEHHKSPTGFPEAMISTKVSQNFSSDKWFENDTSSQIKSEGISDLQNIELLYGSVLSPDETICSPLPYGTTREGDVLYRDNLTSDILSVNDSSLYDLYCTDRSMPKAKEYSSIVSDSYSEACSPPSFWGSCPLDVETLKMDDVFQVDEDDLVQSPTLAELNANDESLFDSFDNFDVAFTLEKKSSKSSLLTASLCETTLLKTDPDSYSEKTNLLHQTDSSDKDNSYSKSRLRSGLDPKDLHPSLSRSDEKSNISSETVTKNIKKIQPFSDSSAKASKGKSPENVSALSSCVKDEILDSEEEDSEMDCDYSSDADEESEEETKVHNSKHVSKTLLLQKKKSRYFWQYNIQSKGPKAPKMKLDGKSSGTDNFSGISDPVFTSSYLNKGIKHSGKARRGDGNDLTPNPQKLYHIGLELEKLTSIIEGLVPANELPLNARSKSRKEKNKLASRACRLKKKAQHEANKLKLFGLHNEQKHLVGVINEVKKIIKKSVDNVKHGKIQSSVQAKIEGLCMKKSHIEVAGCSADFVNNVLKNVGSGDKTGGLDIEANDD